MADDLTLEELENNVREAGNLAKQATYDVLKKKADQLANYFRNSAPVRNGDLRGSVVETEVEFSNARIKFKVEFKGYNKQGEPFQTIANTLNRGFCYKKGNRIIFNSGTHFIDDGVKSILTGIDQEISERFQELAGD